jgi:YebC/PmpR family DNA-binding regulatory protein
MGRWFENNKERMAKSAAAYSKQASYYGKKIAGCVSQGGPNPDANRKLAQLMREAKAMGVRSDVIDRNIKKATEKSTEYKELVYECYGVGGVGFIVSMLSDSNNRASAVVNACVRKLGEKSSPSFKMGSSGSVLFNFEKKARLTLLSPIDEDALIELAIGAGVDDVELQQPDEDMGDSESIKAVAVTLPESLGALQNALQDAGFECAGRFVYLPLAKVQCSPDDLKLNLAALDQLEELEDVDAVEHNIQFD